MADNGGESSGVQIIVIVAIFLSAALGFSAEATNLQLADVKNTTGCTYPNHHKSPTRELGIAAIIALLVSRVYCSTSHDISSPMSRLSLLSSWVAWLGALSFYIVGLVMIEAQGEETRYRQFQQTKYVCKIVKPGIFGAGASFALTSIVLQIIYLVATHHHDGTATVPPSTQRSEVTMF